MNSSNSDDLNSGQPPQRKTTPPTLIRYDVSNKDQTATGLARLRRFFGRIWDFCRMTSPAGRSNSVAETIEQLPGRAMTAAEAHIDKQKLDNDYRIAQTKTEYMTHDLLKAQTEKVREEATAQRLDNFERYIDICTRLSELTNKSDAHLVEMDGKSYLVFADASPLATVAAVSHSVSSIAGLLLQPATLSVLMTAGVTSIEDLCGMRRDEILSIPGIGEKQAILIEIALSKVGRSLKQ